MQYVKKNYSHSCLFGFLNAQKRYVLRIFVSVYFSEKERDISLDSLGDDASQ